MSSKLLLWLLLFPCLLLSCGDDEMDKHYEKPGWLKGTAWEILSNEYGGKYSMFLEAVELSGFRPTLDGKSVVTVMAPDNDAMADYLSKAGYASVKEVETDELKKLIGFHLMYYSYGKGELENFRPENTALGVDQDDDDLVGLQAGMYYKFRTHSTSPITKEVDPETGNTVTVYHLERFLPVFSHNIFTSKDIDAKRNYEYFYPNSTWNGDNGFNVSNASVLEYQVIANNGYIYTIDKVLEPLETLYDVLKKNSDYSDFLDFYSRYSSYVHDVDLSADYGEAAGVEELYLHRHDVYGLPNIALEWPVANHRMYATLASTSYSVFAPSNEALNVFFNKYWKPGGYASLSSLDPLLIKVLLGISVYRGSIVFPDEVTIIKNDWDEGYEFDPYTAKDKSICVNGSFYGLSEFKLPAMCRTVMGPSFLNKNYLYSLYALTGSNLLFNYTTSSTDYTMLVTRNESYDACDIRLAKDGRLDYSLVTTGDDGDKNLTTNELKRMVNAATVNGVVDISSQSGSSVYPTRDASTYWFLRNGKLTTNHIFNNVLEQSQSIALDNYFLEVNEVKNEEGIDWSNGKVYEYESTDYGVIGEPNSVRNNFKTRLKGASESKYPYYVFAQLMRKARIFYLGEDGIITYWDYRLAAETGNIVAFIPTNEVMKEALEGGKIPGIENGSVDLTQASPVIEGNVTDESALRTYLLSYFFSSFYAPVVSSAPYIGSSDWVTGEYNNANNVPVKYTDTGSSISIKIEGERECQVIPDYEYFPFTFSDGSFHLIDATIY